MLLIIFIDFKEIILLVNNFSNIPLTLHFSCIYSTNHTYDTMYCCSVRDAGLRVAGKHVSAFLMRLLSCTGVSCECTISVLNPDCMHVTQLWIQPLVNSGMGYSLHALKAHQYRFNSSANWGDAKLRQTKHSSLNLFSSLFFHRTTLITKICIENPGIRHRCLFYRCCLFVRGRILWS